MSDDTRKILDAINQLVESQTFSAQTTEGIANLRTQKAEMEAKLLSANSRIEALNEDLRRSRAEAESLRAQTTAVAAREGAVKEREADAAEMEKRVAVAEAVQQAYVSMFELVFRNTSIRRQMTGLAPTARDGQSGQWSPDTVSVSEDITETAE